MRLLLWVTMMGIGLPLEGVLYLKKLKNRCVITHEAMSWCWCGVEMIMA